MGGGPRYASPMRWGVLTVGLLIALVASACEKDTPAPPSTLTGVITQIAGGGGEVTGFDLDSAGEAYEIRIDPGRDYGFDLTHLYEHQTTGDPVRVRLRQQDGILYAIRIDDAKTVTSPNLLRPTRRAGGGLAFIPR